jgi:hypothetical protein
MLRNEKFAMTRESGYIAAQVKNGNMKKAYYLFLRLKRL